MLHGRMKEGGFENSRLGKTKLLRRCYRYLERLIDKWLTVEAIRLTKMGTEG
jgi:hypothetical protein